MASRNQSSSPCPRARWLPVWLPVIQVGLQVFVSGFKRTKPRGSHVLSLRRCALHAPRHSSVGKQHTVLHGRSCSRQPWLTPVSCRFFQASPLAHCMTNAFTRSHARSLVRALALGLPPYRLRRGERYPAEPSDPLQDVRLSHPLQIAHKAMYARHVFCRRVPTMLRSACLRDRMRDEDASTDLIPCPFLLPYSFLSRCPLAVIQFEAR
jgi:hypothetical protein